MADPLKSKAVVLYLWGDPPGLVPHADLDKVRRLPISDAAQFVRYVQDLARELFEVFPLGWRAAAEPDPADYDPGWTRSVELVEAEMAARHPELDAKAAKALAWYWGYCTEVACAVCPARCPASRIQGLASRVRQSRCRAVLVASCSWRGCG